MSTDKPDASQRLAGPALQVSVPLEGSRSDAMPANPEVAPTAAGSDAPHVAESSEPEPRCPIQESAMDFPSQGSCLGGEEDPLAREMEQLQKRIEELRRRKEEAETTRHNELLRQQQIQEAQRRKKEEEVRRRLERLRQEEEELHRILAQDAADVELGRLGWGEPFGEARSGGRPFPRRSHQPDYSREPMDHSSDYAHEHESHLPFSTGIRQIKKKATGEDGYPGMQVNSSIDVKSQSRRNFASGSMRRSAAPSIRTGASTSSNVLLRKIAFAVLTDLDDETLRRPDTEPILILITFIKEAALGLFIALLAVSLILFIDHRFLLGLPTARNFRRATFHIVNDRETLANFESDAGIKFMEFAEYAAIKKEIEEANDQIQLAEKALKQRTRDLELLEDDKEQADLEFPVLFKHMGLHKFCKQCMWSESRQVTCLQRVRAQVETYKMPKFDAMASVLKKKACRVSAAQAEEQEKQNNLKEKEDELLRNWADHAEDFCGDCEWDIGMTCQNRRSYLNERYNIPMDRSTAMTMVEQPKCRDSFYVEDNKVIANFCAECDWGWNGKKKMSCAQRVEYLVYMYRNPERVAKLGAMEKPTCHIGHKGGGVLDRKKRLESE